MHQVPSLCTVATGVTAPGNISIRCLLIRAVAWGGHSTAGSAQTPDLTGKHSSEGAGPVLKVCFIYFIL